MSRSGNSAFSRPAGHRPSGDDRGPIVKNVDMDEDMQGDALRIAEQAMEKFAVEKDRASYVKREFDKEYSPTWHCVVGKHFGSFVTHETKHFIYFYIGSMAFLVWKSG